jgi:hypothetical protein
MSTNKKFHKQLDELEKRIGSLEIESSQELEKMIVRFSKFEIKGEIEKNEYIISDPEMNKEFVEFKKTLLDRDEFSPTPIEIIDNQLTEDEIECYKVFICSQKFLEGIRLENGNTIYPEREPEFYKKLALNRIEWLRCKETDFDDYDSILRYQQMKIYAKGAWRDIADMFLEEVKI